MRFRGYHFLYIVITGWFLAVTFSINANTSQLTAFSTLNLDQTRKIDNLIDEKMQQGKIPGISVIVVHGDKIIYAKNHGYANVGEKKAVSDKTFFELGSTTKAFTGLGILYLKQQGLLKLDDPITKYIPWFLATFNGKPVPLKISNFLYQTSGIPSNTSGEIPISSSDDALEKLIRKINGVKLDFLPGTKFQYSTVNYDILGLIIEKISGKSYEDFLTSTILKHFGMDDTYVLRDRAYLNQNMSKGYKFGFRQIIPYDAPTFRSNTPAGYIITNATDLGKWLSIQLQGKRASSWNRLITESHIPDSSVEPGMYGLNYAAGWFAGKDNPSMILHGGENPNFSSFLILNPKKRLAVGVMANLNSNYTEELGFAIFNFIHNDKTHDYHSGDQNNNLDIYCTILMIGSILILIPMITYLFFIIGDIKKKNRTFVGIHRKNIIIGSLLFLITIVIGLFLYCLPWIFLGGLPWEFIIIWSPFSLVPSIIGLYVLVLITCIDLLLLLYFPKIKNCIADPGQTN